MVASIESDSVKMAVVRQLPQNQQSKLIEMFETYALASEFGWTYDQIQENPLLINKSMLAIMQGENERIKKETEQMKSKVNASRRF